MVIIQLRRDTASVWNSVNPVLHEGEMGFETDSRKFKIGDGITPWQGLKYGGLGISNFYFEEFILTADDVAAKKVRLTLSPNPTSKVQVELQGGPTQYSGIDFIVVDDEVRWDSLAIEGLVEVGSIFIVKYFIK
jgi:hypothetical protein